MAKLEAVRVLVRVLLQFRPKKDVVQALVAMGHRCRLEKESACSMPSEALPVEKGDTSLVACIRQNGMDELPVRGEPGPAGDEVNLRERQHKVKGRWIHSHLVEMIVLALDVEVAVALVRDPSGRPTNVDLLACQSPSARPRRDIRRTTHPHPHPCSRGSSKSYRQEGTNRCLRAYTSSLANQKYRRPR